MATASGGTHTTGIHSCYFFFLIIGIFRNVNLPDYRSAYLSLDNDMEIIKDVGKNFMKRAIDKIN